MIPRGNRVTVLALAVFILLAGVLNLIAHHPISDLLVNQVQDDQLPQIHPYACPRNKVPALELDFVICVKRPDEYISREILNAGIWDMGASLLVMSMVRNYPDATFLDIGSNIGPFSVMVASTKYSTVAVDPFSRNLAYIRASTKLQGSEEYVKLIQNTVSSEKMTLIPWTQDPDNEGYVVFLSEKEAATKPSNQTGEGVNSVKFEDILRTIPTDTVVLKIDVEGAECKVLSEYMNSKSKMKFIPYIYMEWSLVKNNNFGLCPNIDQLLQGLAESGYLPHLNGLTGEPDSAANYKNWNDVLWVHEDATLA